MHAPVLSATWKNYSHAQFTRKLTGEEEGQMAEQAKLVIEPITK